MRATPPVGNGQQIYVCVCLVDEYGRVALRRMADRPGQPRTWTMPGEPLEHGEPPAATARRVVSVSSNRRMTGLTLFGVNDDVSEDDGAGPVHTIRLLFRGVATGYRPGHTDYHPNQAVWWSAGEILELTLTPWTNQALIEGWPW